MFRAINKTTFILSILFFIFLLVLFGDDVLSGELTIFDNGQSNYVIVVPDAATEIEQKAAFKSVLLFKRGCFLLIKAQQ